MEAFGKAVTPAEAQANLGFCLAVRGRLDEAKEAYRHRRPGVGLVLPHAPPGQ